MTKTNNKIDYGKALDKLTEKPPKYWMRRMAIGDSLVLTKDDKPILVVPEELQDDFVYLITRANAVERLFPPSNPDDLPTELFTQPKTDQP